MRIDLPLHRFDGEPDRRFHHAGNSQHQRQRRGSRQRAQFGVEPLTIVIGKRASPPGRVHFLGPIVFDLHLSSIGQPAKCLGSQFAEAAAEKQHGRPPNRPPVQR